MYTLVMQRFSLAIVLTVCPEKRDQNIFCNIFYKTRAIFDKIWHMVSLINLLQNHANVFYFIRIMAHSLHYLVKLKMLLRTCYSGINVSY